MGKTLTARAQELAFKEVESSPDPDLAKAILYRARNTGCYLKSLPKGLGVSEGDVMNAVRHLTDAGLIRINEEKGSNDEDFTQIRLTDGADGYFKTDIYGPRDILSIAYIDGNNIVHIMKSVEDLVEFSYRKYFTFPLEELEKLREQSHKSLEHIRADEEMFLHQILGLPQGYKVSGSLCTFVEEKDPENNRFEFGGKFDSPEEALAVGFDFAYGSPIASREFEVYGYKTNTLSCAITIVEEGKDGTWFSLQLKNIRYYAIEFDMGYQEEARRAIPVLKGRLEKALAYIAGD